VLHPPPTSILFPYTTLFRSDIVPFVVKPLWRLVVNYAMTYIFYPSNHFGVNELSSLFHLPARIYNRADSIQRLQYKLVAAPDTRSEEHTSELQSRENLVCRL